MQTRITNLVSFVRKYWAEIALVVLGVIIIRRRIK